MRNRRRWGSMKTLAASERGREREREGECVTKCDFGQARVIVIRFWILSFELS